MQRSVLTPSPRQRAGLSASVGIRPLAVALLVMVLGAVVAARIAIPLFYVSGIALLGLFAVLTLRVPRVALVIVVLAPVADRYLISLVLPTSLESATTFLSEALLLTATLVIGFRGLRDGTLLPALRHPGVLLLAAFVAVAALSAIVNGVPPLVAVAGTVFTVEAAALLLLPRVVGFPLRDATLVVAAFGLVATAAAVLALGQVLLHPDFLGMATFAGRFGEGERVAAFLGNPNMLGVVLAMALPFAAAGLVHGPQRWLRIAAAAAGLVLLLALLYTFSRGAWLGLAVAVVGSGLYVERRALLALLLGAVLAFGAASFLPHHLLDPDGSSGFDFGGGTIGRISDLENDLRLLFIRNGAPIIADHPLIGAGPGRYGGAIAWRLGSPLYDSYTDGAVPRDRTVDNFWLHLVVETGALGVILFAGALATAGWQVLRAARRSDGLRRGLLAALAAAAVVVAVDSLTEMLLEGNTTSFAVWFFLGVGSALGARATDEA